MQTKSLLRQTGLFDHVPEDVLEEVCQSLEHVEFKKGAVIIKEGEIGDVLYIIESGVIRVFTTNSTNEEIVLARLEQGNFFGEQALLDAKPKPRNASVRAITAVKLLRIPHTSLIKVLSNDQKLRESLSVLGKKELLERLTKQISILSTIKDDILKLNTKVVEYKDREPVFFEGDPPDYVYLVLEGQVRIHITEKKNTPEQTLVLSHGHLFGEFGILQNQNRFGTAKAENYLKVLAISAKEFRSLYEKNPELQNLINSMQRIYQVPGRGIVHQYHAKVSGIDTICSTFKLEDGSTVISSSAINGDIFSIMRIGEKVDRTLRYQQDENIWRELNLAGNKLVGVTNFCLWEDLTTISVMVLNGVTIDEQQEAQFLKNGLPTSVLPSISIGEEKELICECMSVDRATIMSAIRSGATTPEQVSNRTGASTVCGSCRTKIMDILGTSIWFAASLSFLQEHNENVRTYVLKPLNEQFKSFHPGQYINIKVPIDENWVERTYTLTSLPEEERYLITVKKEPLGLFSRWLFDQNQEIPLARVSPPQGQFIINFTDEKPAVCFVGGIGVTPIFTFASAFAKANCQRRLHIEYSATVPENFIFLDELNRIKQACANITLNLRVTGKEGHMTTKDVQNILKQFSNPEVFICGPEGFENTVTQAAKESGVPSQNIHVEKFTHAGGKTND